MVQATYYFKPWEIDYLNQINGQSTVKFLSVILLVHLALMPPMLAAFLIGNIAALTVLAILYGVAILVLLWGRLTNQSEKNPREYEITFTAKSRRETCNGSISEVLLTDFERWRETGDFFELERFGVTMVEPKRAYTPEQQEILRTYFSMIDEANRFKEVREPCELFVDTHSGNKTLARWTFKNNREDFNNFKKGGFRQISLDQPGEVFRQPTRLIVNIIFGIIFAVVVVPYIAVGFLNETQAALAWCFFIGWPVLTSWAVLWIWKRRSSAGLDKIKDTMFDREVDFGIQSDAWFMGNASSMTVHPWVNVDQFSLSRTLFLITTSGLAYMIPRRILGDETEFRKAVMFTLQTHGNATRQGPVPGDPSDAVEAIESGNPFQSPRA